MSLASLTVHQLSFYFGLEPILENVSFSLNPGERVGLIGPNGAGKTTIFNLIAGTLAPTRGSIRFQGREIGGEPANKVAHHGIEIRRTSETQAGQIFVPQVNIFLMIGVDDRVNRALFAALPGEAAPTPTPRPSRRSRR